MPATEVILCIGKIMNWKIFGYVSMYRIILVTN
jgi:hypothetical protein